MGCMFRNWLMFLMKKGLLVPRFLLDFRYLCFRKSWIVSLATRAFELRLMKFLGYQPRLENCLGCGIIPSEKIWFSREGGVLCANCKQQFTPVIELSLGAWELMKRLLTSDFSRLSILRPSQQLLDEIEIAMRAYLDFRMERPLKSLPFLMSLCSPNGLTRRIEVNE